MNKNKDIVRLKGIISEAVSEVQKDVIKENINKRMNEMSLQELRDLEEGMFGQAWGALKGGAKATGQAAGKLAGGAAKAVGTAVSTALQKPIAAIGEELQNIQYAMKQGKKDAIKAEIAKLEQTVQALKQQVASIEDQPPPATAKYTAGA